MSLSQALIGEVLPPQQRARYQGYFAIIFTLASVGGPVLGGLVVQLFSWRWLFAVDLPLCALALGASRSSTARTSGDRSRAAPMSPVSCSLP